MAKYEVAFTREETILTRYYITVEADGADAAKQKVLAFDTTVDEEMTIVEGKCLGIEATMMSGVDWVTELEKEYA